MNSSILSSILAIAAGFAMQTYKEYANKQGLPIGKLFLKHNNIVVFIALIAMLTGVVQLFVSAKFLSALLYIGIGLLLSWILTAMLKQNIQWLAFVLLLVAIIVFVIGGAETVTI